MKLLNKAVKVLALTSAVLSATGTFAASEQGENTSKLLTANFESRKIVKIEAGRFSFSSGSNCTCSYPCGTRNRLRIKRSNSVSS